MMPRPVYIICYTMSSQDTETNLLSLYRIIEKIELTKITIPPLPDGVTTGTIIIEKDPMQAVAVWMKNPADNINDVYEAEMSMFYPGGQSHALGKTEFQFDEKRPIHRIKVSIRGSLEIKEPGLLTIESKLRKKGTSGWNGRDLRGHWFPQAIVANRLVSN